MKTNQLSILLLLIVIVTIFVIAVISLKQKGDKGIAGKTELNVQLQWFDGAQFCGLYVAKEKGYFEEEGLRVKLTPINSFTSDPIDILNNNEADIAIATADQVLINFAQGKSISAVGNVFNRSFACFMHKTNKINNLYDLIDKKIAVFKKFDTENILRAICLKHHIDVKFNEDVIQGGNTDAFINNEIDVYGAYLINEPIDMRLNGVDVEVIDPINYGVTFYSDTYITNATFLKSNREVVKKFLRASAKGWHYCKLNPEESIEIMFKNISNKTRDEHFNKELASLQEIIKHLGDGRKNYYFYMNRDKWLSMESSLKDIGVINNSGYVDKLCDFNIISEANEN